LRRARPHAAGHGGAPRWRTAALGVAALALVAGCTSTASAGEGLAGESRALPTTITPTTPAPTVAATMTVPGACPDPRGWETYRLAQLLVVPGFNGDTGWPSNLPGGTAGVFVPKGSAGLNAGLFGGSLPGDPQPFVSIDYEGGQVMDHAGLIGNAPSARDQANSMSPEQVRELANQRGGAMAHYGVNVDFAPVVDLDLGSPIVGNRAFSSDPDTVTTYAKAWAEGLRAGGVLPVIKHFPGHGSANGDSHKGIATTEPWEVLRDRDVKVYRDLLATPGPWMVMMGHLVVPGLSFDSDTPTSVDPAAYRALRETTGWTGPVITDDLAAMKAITDRLSVPEAVVSAISAGADLALITTTATYDASVEALAAWGDADPAHREQLTASAMRALQALPCGTGY
jgi:beta-N-acetylhexosaminidase